MNNTAAHGADSEAVRAAVAVQVVSRLSASATFHVLNGNRRISRNVFAQDRHHGFNAQIASPSGSRAGNHRNCLILIERRLGKSADCKDLQADQ